MDTHLGNIINSGLIGLNSALISVVGFFLVRALKHVDEASNAQIALATEVRVLIERFQNQKALLEKHEASDAKEHTRIREDIDLLANRDHALGNMIHQLYGHASLNGWEIPEPNDLPRRKSRN